MREGRKMVARCKSHGTLESAFPVISNTILVLSEQSYVARDSLPHILVFVGTLNTVQDSSGGRTLIKISGLGYGMYFQYSALPQGGSRGFTGHSPCWMYFHVKWCFPDPTHSSEFESELPSSPSLEVVPLASRRRPPGSTILALAFGGITTSSSTTRSPPSSSILHFTSTIPTLLSNFASAHSKA